MAIEDFTGIRIKEPVKPIPADLLDSLRIGSDEQIEHYKQKEMRRFPASYIRQVVEWLRIKPSMLDDLVVVICYCSMALAAVSVIVGGVMTFLGEAYYPNIALMAQITFISAIIAVGILWLYGIMGFSFETLQRQSQWIKMETHSSDMDKEILAKINEVQGKLRGSNSYSFTVYELRHSWCPLRGAMLCLMPNRDNPEQEVTVGIWNENHESVFFVR